MDGAIGLEGTPVEDDDYFEKLEKSIQDVQIVCFLGHGSFSSLYGPHDNPLICKEMVIWNCLRVKHCIWMHAKVQII